MKKKNTESLIEKASDLFDLPGNILAGMPRVEIIGCRQVIVENHKGILGYEDNLIAINGGKAKVILRGEHMEIKSMNTAELLVTGEIFGVEFEY